MKKLFVTACFMLAMFCTHAQFLIFLDKGDIFTSPQVDMVVMDKTSFSKLHYTADQYDSLRSDLRKYDSLLSERANTEEELRADYESIILNKEEQLYSITSAYEQVKGNLEQSIDRQNKLQVDYLKLEQKNKRVKRWRNIFMGTSALLGGVIVMAITH